ncbi:hypothetical protein J4456_03635 [Candidatus Pacearchaeota archaeon]|nr:hypothetical protein [Candidatus Pacearchaeota archaeon]
MITNPIDDFPHHILNGPITNKEHRSVLPYQELTSNGFIPYTFLNNLNLTPYQRATYALRESNRQAQLPATIAQFKLEFL